MVLIIAFKAENTIIEVLDRIPDVIWDKSNEVLIIDDASPSPDKTFEFSLNYKNKYNLDKLTVRKNIQIIVQ